MESCTDREEYHLIIKNESGMDIEFIPYFHDIPNLQRKATLLNNDKINKTFVATHLNEFYHLTHAIFGTAGLSHIEIVFNNQRKILYKDCYIERQNCFNNPRSIFYHEYNYKHNSIYTVTAEDYQNAEDCNGNCY